MHLWPMGVRQAPEPLVLTGYRIACIYRDTYRGDLDACLSAAAERIESRQSVCPDDPTECCGAGGG